jgi:hypothetical protein
VWKQVLLVASPREGQWFAVPIASDEYAVGLVARAQRRGDTLFGYFFGPLRREPAKLEETSQYKAADAVLIARFRHDALVSGQWPLIASATDWNRSEWPMPEFHVPFTYEATGESWAVMYADDDPDRSVRRRRISVEEEADYPADGELAPAHVERMLAEELGAYRVQEETDAKDGIYEEGVRHFLLIPRSATREIRRQLTELGLEDVEVLDERNGLVDVVVVQRGVALRESIDEMETRLTAIAQSVGGQYDGLEWAVPPS